MKKKKAASPEKEMSFLDHLEELRWHLVRSTFAVLIMAVVAFIFKGFVFDVLIFGPTRPSFATYRMFCNISQAMGMDSFCFQEMPFSIQSRKDRKSTRLNSSHVRISYAVFCLKKKK